MPNDHTLARTADLDGPSLRSRLATPRPLGFDGVDAPSKPAAAGEVAYILKGYPRLSETFIAAEIHLLETLGMQLRLYSVKEGESGKRHGIVSRIRAPLTYLPEATSTSGRALPAWLAGNLPRFARHHARVAIRHPLRWLRTFGMALGMSWRYREPGTVTLRKVFIKEFLQAGAIAADLQGHPEVRHLHGHFCHGATTITWFVARLTGLAFSFTAHAKDIYQKKLNPGDLLPRKMRAARFAVTCTGANATHLATVCGDCGDLHTIFHGLDTERFSPPPSQRVPGEAPLILTVGRFVEKKGFEHLVRACAELHRAGVAFRAMIVGERGEDYERIAGLVASLGLERVMTLHGPVSQEELRDIYARTDLFVLPCQVMEDGDRDGIPNVMAEAMAMGLPIVSTDISGIPELVDAGVDGLLVPSRDLPALVAAMRTLIDSAELRAAIGRAARAKILERFDSARTTRRLHALFQQALHEGASVRR